MKSTNPFRKLNRFEMCLWIISIVIVTGTFFLFQSTNTLTLIASLIGVTALIFVAKGHAIGQALTVVFAVFYGIISFYLRYYGEMITYLGMTAPIAVISLISWVRHPYKQTKEVQVSRLSKKQVWMMTILSVVVTTSFYFILKAMNNANLFFSTISVTTSFIASYLTACRSQFYALAYAANDIVLIVLWSLASITDISYIPMLTCFLVFFANDIYGFFNWRRMKRCQGV